MSRILLSFIYLISFSFPAHAQKPAPLLEEPGLKELYRKKVSVGALLRLLQAVAPRDEVDQIRKVIGDVGLTETYILQDLEISGNQVTLPEGKLSLNMEALIQGQVSLGGFNYQRKAFKNEFERFKALVQFVAYKNRNFTGIERLLLPSAVAEQSYSDWLKEKGLKTTAYILAVTSYTAVLAVMWGVFEGAAFASPLVAGGVVVAAGLALGLAIETLIKAGNRYADGVEIVCVNGQLKLKGKSFEEKLDSGSVGIAELKFRELLCGAPERLAKFNQLLQEHLKIPSAPSPAAPKARATR